MGRWLAVGAAASLVPPLLPCPSVIHILTGLTAQGDISPVGPSTIIPAFPLFGAGGDQAMQREP